MTGSRGIGPQDLRRKPCLEPCRQRWDHEMNRTLTALALTCLAIYGCGPVVSQPSMSEGQAKESFARITGIPWQPDFTLVKHRDDHRGLLGDGEFAVVAVVPPTTVASLLAAAPPWGVKWNTGPVDGEIGFHCSFIYSDAPGVEGDGTGAAWYVGGAEEVRAVLSSRDTMWCAMQRGHESMPWHNGNLLIVEPASNRLWLSVWDF